MCFLLGTHKVQWLETAGVPLFISRRSFEKRKKYPRAIAPWCMDSSGFTELGMHGRWTFTHREYVAIVRRARDEVGMLMWAAICDWMCEDIIRAKTGLSTREHQERTIQSLLELRSMAPDVPWTPVLQGQKKDDYLDHLEMYERAGVDLRLEPVVGLGSVCRRQATDEVVAIVRALSVAHGINLHGFGVKTLGLRKVADLLTSADSTAWSAHARRRPSLPECAADPTTNHKNCANCMRYAMAWRERAINGLADRWHHADDKTCVPAA